MTEKKPQRENAQSTPVTLKGGNPSAVDRLHQATSGQGEASPEDYPEAERRAQVEAATGKPA